MGRASRHQADLNRESVVAGASRVMREHGVDKSAIAEIMLEAGLSHGAFYSQFESKEELAAEACAYAFDVATKHWNALVDNAAHGTGEVRAAVLERYLSAAHRDDPRTGCPGAALAPDATRDNEALRLRGAYVAGIAGMTDAVERMMPASLSKKRRRQRALQTVATMLGAVTIARATQGSAFSDDILQAAREALLGDAR